MATLESFIEKLAKKQVANDNERMPLEPEPVLPPYDYREVEENEET